MMCTQERRRTLALQYDRVMKEEGMLGDKSLAKRRHTQGVITSRVAMRMHEVLCGSHLLLLGAAKCLYMGQL